MGKKLQTRNGKLQDIHLSIIFLDDITCFNYSAWMHLLRCTKKLITEMGLKERGLVQEEDDTTGLGDWYANIFKYSRFKCLIFTNEMTLFSFVIFRVGKREITQLSGEFHYHMHLALKHEGIPGNVILAILKDYHHMGYGKTNNRSVLGSMNDISNRYKFMLDRFDRIDNLDPDSLQSLNHKLNRIPLKTIGYKYPIKKLQDVLKFRYQ